MSDQSQHSKNEAEVFSRLAIAFAEAMDVGLSRSMSLSPELSKRMVDAAAAGWSIQMTIRPGRTVHTIKSEMIGRDKDGDMASLTLFEYSTAGNDVHDVDTSTMN